MVDLEKIDKVLEETVYTLQGAKNYSDNGQQVFCSRKLQSAMSKCIYIRTLLNLPEETGDADVVAEADN